MFKLETYDHLKVLKTTMYTLKKIDLLKKSSLDTEGKITKRKENEACM